MLKNKKAPIDVGAFYAFKAKNYSVVFGADSSPF